MPVSGLFFVRSPFRDPTSRRKALSGELDGVQALVENSSGNTVFSLAIAARQFGVERTFSYVPAKISWNKLLMLLFFGVEPVVNQEPPNPSENDPASGVYKTRKDGERFDMLNPGQYENPDNPGAPYHPPTQEKIEHCRQTLKNRILLDNYYFPV